MSLTDAQLVERRSYLGGTDAAALAGVNPPGWRQPIDVYLEKVGEAEVRPSSRMQAMGTLLEDVVGQLFTEATGLRLRRPNKHVRNRAMPWVGGNLDRWASDGCPVELKFTQARRDEWGPGLGVGTVEAPVVIPAPGDESYRPRVPLRYAVQVQHYLMATDRQLAYLAVLLGYGDFRWYALHRDERVIGHLRELEERFWHEHVLRRVPPEPDGSESYGRQLRQLYSADDGLEAVATPEQLQLVAWLRAAEVAYVNAAIERERMRQLLQASMGSTSKLVGPGFTITWRATRPRTVVQWEELALDLLGQLPPAARAITGEPPATKKGRAEWLRAVAQAMGHASEEPGTRPFRVEFEDEEG